MPLLLTRNLREEFLLKLSWLCLSFLFTVPTFAQTESKHIKNVPPPEEKTLDVPAAMESVVSLVISDTEGKDIAQGSGFLVDGSGKVVTNFHVIEKAASVVVKSTEGAFYPVTGILAIHKDNDLAVLKVSGKHFKILRLADSDGVRVGDKVVAIGSPLGLEQTVSDGLISGIRDVDSSKVFQTTAAISPGSSGGVLLNAHGEVIAVTAFQLTSGQNLNFAIPVNYVKPLLTSSAVVPFSPIGASLSSTNGEPPRRATPSPTIPKYWTHLGDGSTVEVRIDGDHLYEMSDHLKDKYICDLKLQDNAWVGKCTYHIATGDGIALSFRYCTLEADEFITSVSPTRIEGKSQNIESGGPVQYPNGIYGGGFQPCPRTGTGRTQFVLIPRD
jgi:hypothetical protein